MVEDPVSSQDPRAADLARFAAALAGAAGAWAVDVLVSETLARAPPADARAAGLAPRERMFREVIRLNRRRALAAPVDYDEEPPMRRAEDFVRRVDRLPLEEKEALLLTALARFSYAESARVLDCDRANMIERLMRARARLDCGQPVAPAGRPTYLRVIK